MKYAPTVEKVHDAFLAFRPSWVSASKIATYINSRVDDVEKILNEGDGTVYKREGRGDEAIWFLKDTEPVVTEE